MSDFDDCYYWEPIGEATFLYPTSRDDDWDEAVIVLLTRVYIDDYFLIQESEAEKWTVENYSKQLARSLITEVLEQLYPSACKLRKLRNFGAHRLRSRLISEIVDAEARQISKIVKKEFMDSVIVDRYLGIEDNCEIEVENTLQGIVHKLCDTLSILEASSLCSVQGIVH